VEPVKWGPGRLDRLRDWLDFEIPYALMNRTGLERQWRDWLIQYRPSPLQPRRSIPFEGAANYVLPLTATDVDQMYASFMQTIHAAEDLWYLSALNERWEPAAKPLQDLLTFLDKTTLQMYKVNQRAIMEMVKLGTGIYKHGWYYERRPIHRYRDDGKWERVTKRVGRPLVQHVSLPDLLVPPSATAIQADDQGGAPWVAERIRMPVDRFRWMANSGEYPTISKEVVETIISHEERASTEHKAAVQDLDYLRRAFPSVSFDKDTGVGVTSQGGRVYVREIELWEVHARFATEGDSEDDIILWWHPATRIVMRPIYQPYLHGKRPFEVTRFFPGDGFYGIGLCEQKEIYQKIESELFNFMHDGVFLSNSIGIVAQEGSNIAPGEPIYPGKIWITNGPVKDAMTTFQMGNIYPDLPNLIQYVRQTSQQRTSVSDLMSGNLQALPDRTPASTTQSLLREGKLRPDLAIKDLRYSGLGVIGLRVLQYLQQYAQAPTKHDRGGQQWIQIALDVLGSPEGQLVAEKLVMPAEQAEFGLGVSISAVSSAGNKEVEQQRLQGLLGQHAALAPTYLSLIQTAMQATGTPIAEVALELAQGMTLLYRRLLEQDDFRDPQAIAPEIPTDVPPALPLPGAPPGGAAAGGAPDPAAGMAGVPQGAGAPVPFGG
jgi:hypothetical protein